MLTTIQNPSLNKKAALVPGILQRYEIQQLIFDAKLDHSQGTSSFSHQLEWLAKILLIPILIFAYFRIITESDANPTRCPFCHCSHVKLICVNCLGSNVIRTGKVCEEKGRLLSSKKAICQLIKNALADEVHEQISVISNSKIKFSSNLKRIFIIFGDLLKSYALKLRGRGSRLEGWGKKFPIQSVRAKGTGEMSHYLKFLKSLYIDLPPCI